MLYSNPLHARQEGGTLSGITGTFLSKEFAQVFGAPPQCCHDFPDNDCWAGKGKADSGDEWERCYSKGDYLWLGDDSATANYLIDLHSTQDDACISVAGSACEVGKGTSKILNSRVRYLVGNEQISRAIPWAMQAASNALVNEMVASCADQDGGDQVEVLHKLPNGLGVVSINFRFGGGQQC
jgi:hypothetical protein